MSSGGVGKYEIVGSADGKTVKAYISVVEYNYLTNAGFEDGNTNGWIITEHGKASELFVENKLTDSLSGTWHMHFWSPNVDSVAFNLEQQVSGLSSGLYKFSMSIMGGDAGVTDIYIYVKINGEIVKTAPLEITTYGNWDTALIDGVEYAEGDTITVGIYVQCQGTGSGAWGKIDDAMLNSDSNA